MPAIETNVELTPEAAAKAEYLKFLDFGDANFSLIGETVYHDMHKLFGYSCKEANRIAHFVMREIGAVFSNQKFTLADVKTGKLNKDGKVTLSFAAQKAKGIAMNDALSILQLVQWLNPDSKLGVNQETIRCELSKTMRDICDKHSMTKADREEAGVE